jgi:hypothetical protein
MCPSGPLTKGLWVAWHLQFACGLVLFHTHDAQGRPDFGWKRTLSAGWMRFFRLD